MKKNIQLVKGTHDIYGDEIKKFNFILEKFYSVTEKFNFHQVQTPIIEHQDLFTRSCLLYTSPSPRDRSLSRMPSSA